MSIQVNDGFFVGSPVPIDTRLTLSLSQMLNMNDNLMPDVYMTVCTDDKMLYLYNKSATPNLISGKFTKLSTDVNYSNNIVFSNHYEFPNTGDSNTLYIAEDENVTYRWDSDLNIYVALNQPSFDTIQSIL